MLFFLLSGMSGLIYEVLWTRVLLTVFGATLYAVATVLAAFMGGLALGSLIGGRIADRSKRPLGLYGGLEIVVAVLAILVPVMLRFFDPLYRMVYAGNPNSFLGLSLMRFVLSFIVLLLPTTAMGATLPLLSRFLVHRADVAGSRIGGLYAVNTTGAVLGVFLAGFVLIARFGTDGTLIIAAILSLISGLGALLVSRRYEPAPYLPEEQPPEKPEREGIDEAPDIPASWVKGILFSYVVSGFVALAYQVLWTRALVFRFEYLKNTTYSFSAMLTVFLVGLAAGSALMAARVDRQKDPLRLYGLIQLLTGLSGAFSLFMLISVAGGLYLGEPLNLETFSFNWALAVGNVFLRTVATIGLPTFMMGMAFPVVARLCVRHFSSLGKGIGRLYAANTIGAILGAFAAGFLLIPLFGLARGILVLGLINVLIGMAVLLANPRGGKAGRMVWSALALLVLLLFFVRIPGNYTFHTLPDAHLPEERRVYKMVAYEEGPLATCAVVEDSIGDRTIYVDNVGVAGTDRILLTDQKSLAHVPMLILENPESALTVGFGSGGASWSFTLYPELKQVDCIEISETVPRMAPFLRDSNYGLLDEWDGKDLTGKTFHNGRYRILFDDARSYLRFTENAYDIIATDCTDLRYKSNANLYDVEYFELCRKRITPDGMVVVWMPLAGMSPEVFACAMKTFAHVFPDMTVWYMHNAPTHYLLLLGTKEPLQININRMLERIGRPAIKQDLAAVSLQQPEKILSCFLQEAPALEKDFAEAPLNTETDPYLEFESPKFGYSDEPLLVNLELLRKHKTSVVPYITDAEKHPRFMERLGRFIQAVDPILEGHAHLRRLEMAEACRSYLKAQAICPEDESVDFMLRFDTLSRRVKRYPGNLWAVVTLADLRFIQGRYEQAGALYNQAIQVARAMGAQEGADPKENRRWMEKSVLGLAGCYAALNLENRAREILTEYEPYLSPKNVKVQEMRQSLGLPAAAHQGE